MSELDLVQLADNPDPRAPCLLLLDTSASMGGEPIRALNEGLRVFKQDLMQDELAKRRVEIALLTFGAGGVREVQNFVTADQWQPPELGAGGSTPLGLALERGLELLRKRKDMYREAGLQYFRPWLFLITDGEPTDQYTEAARLVRQEDSGNGLTFFVVGVERANMDKLAGIASPGRPPLKLRGLEFAELFLWLSQSQQRVSHSRVGEQLALPPVGWSEVST
ncbi:MAG TPA: VWA domain-containing protein [Deinococcales bacterium]|nr:VWA domain-containing protein [Deinococcales bacterium]